MIDIRTLLFINMYMLCIRKDLIHCTPQIRHKWKNVRMELVTLFALITEETSDEIIQDLLYNENIIQNFDTGKENFSERGYQIHQTVRVNLEETTDHISSLTIENKLGKIEESINLLKGAHCENKRLVTCDFMGYVSSETG